VDLSGPATYRFARRRTISILSCDFLENRLADHPPHLLNSSR
jgi:hypothetical protein